MSWASERLSYLNRNQSYAQISKLTEIPTATISYVLRDIRPLPNAYRLSLRRVYQRTVYNDLKAIGLSATQARRFSWYSPSRVQQVISEVGSVLETLVTYRLQAYSEYLKGQGRYIDEQTTRSVLREAIQQAMQRSDLPEERLQVMEYNSSLSA